MTKMRRDLIWNNVDPSESILNKRKVAIDKKIEKSEIHLKKAMKEMKKEGIIAPSEQLERLRKESFHLEALLEHKENRWVLRSDDIKVPKEGSNSEKKEGNFEIEDIKTDLDTDDEIEKQNVQKGFEITISDELANLISPEKVSQERAIKQFKGVGKEEVKQIEKGLKKLWTKLGQGSLGISILEDEHKKGILENEPKKGTFYDEEVFSDIRSEFKDSEIELYDEEEIRPEFKDSKAKLYDEKLKLQEKKIKNQERFLEVDKALKNVQSLSKNPFYEKELFGFDLELMPKEEFEKLKKMNVAVKENIKETFVGGDQSRKEYKHKILDEVTKEFLLQAALDGRMDKWAKNSNSKYKDIAEDYTKRREIILDGLEILANDALLSEGPTENYDIPNKVLEDPSLLIALATRRGEGVDTRNTLVKQLIKLIEREKMRQERNFNAFRTGTDMVGALGGVGLAVVSVLAIGGVIGLSSSVVGLSVLGFAVAMTVVGLAVLKVKKPNLFKSVMKGTLFRLAFNSAKASWNEMHQSKIERKEDTNKEFLELISAKAPDKMKIKTFLGKVEHNEGRFPDWKHTDHAILKMIAGIEDVSLQKLEIDWPSYKGTKADELLEKVKNHKHIVYQEAPEKKIGKFMDFYARNETFPAWKDVDPAMRKMIASVEDLTVEQLKQKRSSYHGEKAEKLFEKLEHHQDSHNNSIFENFIRTLREHQGIDGDGKGPEWKDIDPKAELVWEELFEGQGSEDKEIAQLLKYEMGIEINSFSWEAGKDLKASMKEKFLRDFRGYLALGGNALIKRMSNIEEEIQRDFSNPIQIIKESK